MGARSRAAGTAKSAASEGWGRAIVKAAAVLVLCAVGFLFVPDRLLAFLTTRVGPKVRDALVAGWVIVFFLALSGGFVALQRERRR
jgi:hypothetical protein